LGENERLAGGKIMIKIFNIEIDGWQAAIRGMRNPMNSWSKSDSTYSPLEIGQADLQLMANLSKAGTEHGKFMRMINITFDIEAPLYYWKEFDTYKVGTTRNSCSTMHKIQSKEFTLNDFSCEHLNEDSIRGLGTIVQILNKYRGDFNSTKNKDNWWQMIQLLPSSYNQKATISTNYAVLKNIYHQRKNHKLDEWREFCDWIETLPYAQELIVNA
jgi:hypothetical protein